MMEIQRFYEHPVVHWDLLTWRFFTYMEFEPLLKRFRHPHVDKLFNLLKRAGLDNVDAPARKMFETITQNCSPWQTYARAPRRSKFILCEDRYINHSVFVDTLRISSKMIFLVVDWATRYQAARWLLNVTAETVWRAVCFCEIKVHLGRLDVVTHDTGKHFVPKLFQRNAEILQINTTCVSFQAPSSLTFVERYHTPTWYAYKILTLKAPDLDAEAVIHVAVNPSMVPLKPTVS